MADNITLSVPVGSGAVMRTFFDVNSIEWSAGVCSYVTGGSAGAWNVAQVDITHGLPIQPMTGVTFAVSAASLPLPAGASTEATLSALNTKVTACNTGAVVISAALPAGSNAIGGVTQSGVWNVTNISGTVSLPTGAATSALQTTGNTSLASIDTKTPALGQAIAAASVPVVLTAAQIATLTPLSTVSISGSVAVTGTFWQATQPISAASLPLPTGASTETTLSTLNGKVTACNTGAVTISAALPAGTNVIGHVINDASSAVIGHVITDSGSTTAVTGTVTVSGAVTQSGTWTVGISAAQTIAVTNTGTFAVQAAQSGTWNITNISGTVSLPTGASTAAKQPALGTAGSASTDVITIQGIASMTPLLATQSGTWNIGTVTTVTTVSTVTAVTAITNALPAGTNLLGKVGIDQTTPGTTNATQSIAGTTGGYTPGSFLSTAAVQATVIKASAGNLYKLNFTNIGATPVYVRLYNQTTTPASTDTPVYRFTVPGNTAGAGIIETFPAGLTFATGIGFRCTGAIADNDTTVLSANTVIGSWAFK
jgi:hypothetical protein